MAEEGGGIVPEQVKQKAGPLPIWVWAVLAAAGIGLFLIFRRGSTAGTSTDPLAVQGISGGNAPITDPMSQNDLLNGLSQLGPGPGKIGDMGFKVGTTKLKQTAAAVKVPSVFNMPWQPGHPAGPPDTRPPQSPMLPELQALSTTHTTGGKSTALLTSAGGTKL